MSEQTLLSNISVPTGSPFAIQQVSVGLHPSKPSLGRLAEILRTPGIWPPGFVWNYAAPECGPLMLAHQFWFNPQTQRLGHYKMAEWAKELFDIDYDAARYIFRGMKMPWSLKRAITFKRRLQISPFHVAAAIDAYLSFREREQAFNSFPENKTAMAHASRWNPTGPANHD